MLSKVVVHCIFIVFVIHEFVTCSVEWKTTIDPGEELIIGVVFCSNVMFDVCFVGNIVTSVGFM